MGDEVGEGVERGSSEIGELVVGGGVRASIAEVVGDTVGASLVEGIRKASCS